MTPRQLEEYRALRATIRERGTARVWVALAGLLGWAGLAIGTAAAVPFPVATLIPLVVLAATFELVYALHTGVERIGRYLQVFFEDEAGDPGWETRVMTYGRRFSAAGADPLLTGIFGAAAACNLVPCLLAGAVPVEWAVVGGVHLLVLGRLVLARRNAARQRPIDLERFQQLKTPPGA
jgi:hypothetical protein